MVPDNLSVFLLLFLRQQNLPTKSNFLLLIPAHKIQWSNRRALITGGEIGWSWTPEAGGRCRRRGWPWFLHAETKNTGAGQTQESHMEGKLVQGAFFLSICFVWNKYIQMYMPVLIHYDTLYFFMYTVHLYYMPLSISATCHWIKKRGAETEKTD